jgi:DNA-binding IclR family transcriptional regulator
VRCISAPVFNGHGKPVGCIGIDGPTVRMAEDRLEVLASHVKASAEHLTVAINQAGRSNGGTRADVSNPDCSRGS